MSSRMERYYRSSTPKKRSQVNQDLYRSIYEDGEYSNIEAVAEMDKNNEIDITKIKKMLKNREDYKKQKQYRGLIKEEQQNIKPEKETVSKSVEPKKNYDVMDILTKAKENEKIEDNKYLSLDNTNYNILKELKVQKEQAKNEEKGEELKDLINTITNTSMLNKMGDKELSLNMFDDLSSTKTNDVVKSLVSDDPKLDTTKYDTSFFTSSLSIKKDDFVDPQFVPKKKHKFLKFIVFIICLGITLGIIYFVYSLIK